MIQLIPVLFAARRFADAGTGPERGIADRDVELTPRSCVPVAYEVGRKKLVVTCLATLRPT